MNTTEQIFCGKILRAANYGEKRGEKENTGENGTESNRVLSSQGCLELGLVGFLLEFPINSFLIHPRAKALGLAVTRRLMLLCYGLAVSAIESFATHKYVIEKLNHSDDGRNKRPTKQQIENTLNPLPEVKLMNADAPEK